MEDMKQRAKSIFLSKSLLQWAVEGVSLLIVLCGIAVSIRMLLVGRALWYDESALAWSFCQRSLWELTATELDYVQSAPVGWLWVLKLYSLVFGTSVYALRVPSLLAYVGTLFLMYVLFKKVLKVYFPMVGVAFAASMPLLVQYSNMFKPYITDGFFCLLAIWLFYLWQEGRVKPLAFAILWAVLIWFSNPVVFVEAGMMASLFFCALISKDGARIRKVFFLCVKIGVVLLVSFAVYYFYWLRQTAVENASMLDYWKDWHFPLIPTSVAQVKKAISLIGYLFYQFYRLEYVVLILTAIFAVWALLKKNLYVIGMYLSIGVAFAASWLHKFPVNKRLWLFMYVLLILILFAGLDDLIRRSETPKRSAWIVGALMLGMAVLNGGIRYYARIENIYWDGYEVGLEYDYLKEHIEDEPVYIFSPIIPEFAHVNDYNLTSLKGTDHPVICGTAPLGEAYDCAEDLKTITESDRMYLFFSDSWDNPSLTGQLFTANHDAGFLEMVYNEYETPLWRFCKQLEDTKAGVSWEMVEQTETEEGILCKLRVTNTGESYLNPAFENAVITNCFETTEDNRYLDTFPSKDPARQSVAVPENVKPGESFEIELLAPKGGASQTYRLCNEYGVACRDELVLTVN